MEVQQVDGLEWVRSRPSQFFAGGRVSPAALFPYLVGDVVELGGGECRVVMRGAWCFLSSDHDWMRHPTIPVAALFQRVVPAPGHGEHSLRGEVLLMAFAADVVTTAPGDRLVVKGTPPDEVLVRAAVDATWARRWVAFRI